MSSSRFRVQDVLALILFLTGLKTIAVSRADVTIVSRAAMNGSLNPPREGQAAKPVSKNVVITTYIQGRCIRADFGDVSYIYNAATSQRYRVSNVHKTYAVIPDDSAEDAQIAAGIAVKSTLSFASTGSRAQKAGLWSAEFAYKNVLTMRRRQDETSGCFTGAGAPPMPQMSATIQGQEWVAQIPNLPPDIGVLLSKVSVIDRLTLGIPNVKPLAERINALRGYPVAMHRVVTVAERGNPGDAAIPDTTLTVDVESTSVRYGVLPKSIFEVPPGYKLIQMPKNTRLVPAHLSGSRLASAR